MNGTGEEQHSCLGLMRCLATTLRGLLHAREQTVEGSQLQARRAAVSSVLGAVTDGGKVER